MYNSEIPSHAELPTTKQLIRSTLIALCVAIILLITVILPAEYAIDPTGVGKMIGLTKMGEIKGQLAQEALEDQQRNKVVVNKIPARNQIGTLTNAAPSMNLNNEATEVVWKDKVMLTLKPGQATEVKLLMDKGQIAQFEWVAKGGPVNHDTHGDGNGNTISYKKGRGVLNESGELVAAFGGNHGWYFRNRNDNTVIVILRTSGEYSQMKRVL